MLLLVICIGIAALSGAAWFGAILLIDPHRSEKGSTGSLFISLLFGFASIPLVFLMYGIVPDLGSDIQNAMGQYIVRNLLIVGPAEEFAKFFIFFLIMISRKPVQEPLDGMLHAAAVALAFALTENVKYGLQYGIDVIALRSLIATPAHLTFSCIWGFAYAVLIHANPRRRPRDYVILLFSIFPAAVLHGLSNVLLYLIDEWALLVDGVEFVAAFSLLLWLQRKSPFRPFRLSDASRAVQSIDLHLASNGNSFSLHLRAALARAALRDYGRARGHIDRCLKLRKGEAFSIALSGAIHVLQGETAAGEKALRLSWPSLTTRQRLTLGRLSRHAAGSHRTENAYNEFHLSMWMKNQRAVTRK